RRLSVCIVDFTAIAHESTDLDTRLPARFGRPHDPESCFGNALSDELERRQENVPALAEIFAPDEKDHRSVSVRRKEPLRKRIEVDAASHDRDPLVRDPIERPERCRGWLGHREYVTGLRVHLYLSL